MVAPVDRQSLADVQRLLPETLDRVNRTGEVEMITVDGEVRGVLLSPSYYESLTFDYEFTEEDVAIVRRSIQQLRSGLGRPAHEVLDEMRRRLLSGEFGPVDEVTE